MLVSALGFLDAGLCRLLASGAFAVSFYFKETSAVLDM